LALAVREDKGAKLANILSLQTDTNILGSSLPCPTHNSSSPEATLEGKLYKWSKTVAVGEDPALLIVSHRIFFGGDWFWGLNSVLHACQAGVLTLEPLCQPQFCKLLQLSYYYYYYYF
jgi:hypothetical protein